jgi:hypothetical protein
VADPAGQPIEEVRRIRDDIEKRVVDTYDDVPIRSFVMTLANRRARALLKERAAVAAGA